MADYVILKSYEEATGRTISSIKQIYTNDLYIIFTDNSVLHVEADTKWGSCEKIDDIELNIVKYVDDKFTERQLGLITLEEYKEWCDAELLKRQEKEKQLELKKLAELKAKYEEQEGRPV